MAYSSVAQESQKAQSQEIQAQKAQSHTAQSHTVAGTINRGSVRKPPRFLVIGYGSDISGDNAAGLQIANDVAAWKVPAIEAMATYQLTPALVNAIASADYVFFVSACCRSNHAKTLQIDPLVVGNVRSHSSKTDASETDSSETDAPTTDAHACSPLTLLTLAQQLYNRSPQSWLLRIPTVSVDSNATREHREDALSSAAQNACDQALRTIEQFFMSYSTLH